MLDSELVVVDVRVGVHADGHHATEQGVVLHTCRANRESRRRSGLLALLRQASSLE